MTPPTRLVPDLPKVAILVHACDRYEFLYKGFGHFFARFWDFNVPCNYYFATEALNVAIPGFRNIRSGKGAWSDRLRILLEEKIPEEYVLYFQEDMWLSRPVKGGFLTRLFEQAIGHKWRQVKLHSANVYKTTGTDVFLEGLNLTVLDNQASEYLMSHQVTLWKKEFLIQQLQKNEHPWRNERKATKRLKKQNPVIHHLDFFAENGTAAINDNKSEAARSEYRTVSLNGTLNDNIQPFIGQLMTGQDEEQEYASKLLHHYQHQLTHDGNPRPLKKDIFKQLKDLLLKK